MDHIFDETQPIYYQIVQRICAQILRGEYQPGDKLPSVIDAAMYFKVNHNTIQRVYQELIRQGIASAKRGEGTFVTEDRSILDHMHDEMRQSLLKNFITEMRRLGYSSTEVLASIQQYLQTEDQSPVEEIAE